MPGFVEVTLWFCLFWAVAGPLLSQKIADRLEWFILALGLAASTVSWSWSPELFAEAFLRPIKFCGALLAGALVFSVCHDSVGALLRRILSAVGPKPAVFFAVLVSGACAPLLTAPIAMLLLLEILAAMPLNRAAKIHVAVLGAFSVSLSGALSSFGSAVSAVAVAKLATAPYPLGPRFLLELLGAWVVPAVLSLAAAAAIVAPAKPQDAPASAEDPLTLWTMVLLASRMFCFLAGLVLLGSGLLSVLETRILGFAPSTLYWANILSAAIDGATLAAVEITPHMSQEQLRYGLLGILTAAGALVTGDGVNLIAARRLNIGTREWAAVGAPTAACLMAAYFLSLLSSRGL